MRKVRILVAAVAVGFVSLVSAPAGAIEVNEKLSLYGYGNWSYAKTDGNSYVNGNDEGTWDTMEFSLGVAAMPVDKVSIHAQSSWEIGEEGVEPDVDYAFAEYALSPALALRAGRIKQPFGIYTEIFDVGVLSPFNNLAQGLYGPSGFIAEGYMGVGVTGALNITPGLRLGYDLYGGEIESALTTPWAGEEAAQIVEEDEGSTDVQDMVGGRLEAAAGGGSYILGVSGYTGQVDTKTQGEEAEGDRHNVVGAHAELNAGGATLRAEYAYQDAERYTAKAAYAEGSYLITPHWRAALRYDWTKVEPEEDEGIDEELLESTDLGVALNYIVSPQLVVKVAYHAVDGKRFATANEDAPLDDKTSLVTAGVSFAF